MENEWKQYRSKAAAFRAEGYLGEACKYLQKAISSAESYASEGEIALMWNSLAKLYLRTEMYDLGEEAARKSIEIQKRVESSKKNANNLADYYLMLSKILEKLGRYGEALRYGEMSVAQFSLEGGVDAGFIRGIEAYCVVLKNLTWKEWME